MRRTFIAVAVLSLLAACGGSGGSLDSGSTVPSDTIKIGAADFTENQLLAAIYAQALKAKGIKVEQTAPLGTRETYLPALRDGSIDLIPEYTGNLLQYLNKSATQTAPDEVYAALRQTVSAPLTVLDKSAAEDKDAVVLSQAVADRYHVKSIADLAPRCAELVFGGPPEFQTRPDGLPGLQRHYHCTFRQFQPLDAGGPLTHKALTDGQVQAADIFTTDPAIEQDHLVVLADPANNFVAQNVVPLINSTKATDQVRQVLNAISAKLTTQGLIDLNRQLNAPDKPNVDSVATDWLRVNSLG